MQAWVNFEGLCDHGNSEKATVMMQAWPHFEFYHKHIRQSGSSKKKKKRKKYSLFREILYLKEQVLRFLVSPSLFEYLRMCAKSVLSSLRRGYTGKEFTKLQALLAVLWCRRIGHWSVDKFSFLIIQESIYIKRSNISSRQAIACSPFVWRGLNWRPFIGTFSKLVRAWTAWRTLPLNWNHTICFSRLMALGFHLSRVDERKERKEPKNRHLCEVDWSAFADVYLHEYGVKDSVYWSSDTCRSPDKAIVSVNRTSSCSEANFLVVAI